MATWSAIDAKTKFGALLDAAETEGPQVIRRGNQQFVIAIEQESEQRVEEIPEEKPRKFISAWDALRPSFDERYDVDSSGPEPDKPVSNMAALLLNSPLRGSGLKLPSRKWKTRLVKF